MSEEQSALQSYLADCAEYLDGIEGSLLQLEQMEEADTELVNQVFRAIHTVKGGADFLGLSSIKTLSHQAEDLLNLIRNGEQTLTTPVVNALLCSVDCLRSMLANVGDSESVDIQGALEKIRQAMLSSDDSEGDTPDADSHVKFEEALANGAKELQAEFQSEIQKFDGSAFHVYLIQLNLTEFEQRSSVSSEVFFKRLEILGHLIESKVLVDRVELEKTELPAVILLACMLEPSLVKGYLRLHDTEIEQISEGTPQATSSPMLQQEQLSSEVTMPPAETPSPKSAPSIPKTPTPPKPSSSSSKDAMSNEPAKESSNTQSIRVNVDLLDQLMNLAGELVLTRNQLNQSVSHWDQGSIEGTSQRLDLVTSELQTAIMNTRMQPIGIVFSKFQRVVRDLSKRLQKQIALEVHGEEVELDKTILESIGDPLTHLVRNAIDHGLETPDIRRANGKSEEGTLKLMAQHEAGHVMIIIQDDGAGIDAQKIKEKALEKGLKDRQELDEMSEKELVKLVFAPGFSTAQNVSDISGRGVGMDVVHTNLARLGGTIEIETVVGEGTSFIIKLPLTLAIIPSLLVSVNQTQYAIPQVNLVELVRVPPVQVKKRLERIGDKVVIRLRGRLLPIIRLREFLEEPPSEILHPETEELIEDRRERLEDRRGKGLETEGDLAVETKERAQTDRRFRSQGSVNIVVVSAGAFQYGLVVDQLMDSEEIVVKPLGAHLRHCSGYAGATILGDGNAALILDVMGIATTMALHHQENIQREEQERLLKVQSETNQESGLLLVENAPGEQFAIQLGLITRIERIQASSLQTIGGNLVLQYRGHALQVFMIHQALNVSPLELQDSLYLITFPKNGQEVGLLFSQIVDIIQTDDPIDTKTFNESGVIGSLILMEKITLVLDVFLIAQKSMGEAPVMVEASSSTKSNQEKKSPEDLTVLVVDDSKFFRDQVEKIMKRLGLQTITADTGLAGLSTLEQHADTIDLVCSDVEMPEMDGVTMVQELRSKPRFQELPVILLTSLAKDEDVARGKEAGASEYLVKIDQDALTQAVQKLLGI